MSLSTARRIRRRGHRGSERRLWWTLKSKEGKRKKKKFCCHTRTKERGMGGHATRESGERVRRKERKRELCALLSTPCRACCYGCCCCYCCCCIWRFHRSICHLFVRLNKRRDNNGCINVCLMHLSTRRRRKEEKTKEELLFVTRLRH